MSSRTSTTAPTTQARLQSIIKEARNIMRKDAGLNGELDRLPQMAWLLFLKAYDDLEADRVAAHRGHTPVLPERLRWSTWAHDSDLTGEALLDFVNGELLPALRSLRGSGRSDDPKDTLSRVFNDTRNKMLSGHLLRALVDQLDRVLFTSNDDIHTMAFFYESMLREMRDAAGDSGEFYTPRPLIRFIVDRVDPRPGDVVLDPAAGTGGFLVEAFEHMTTRGDLTARQLSEVKTKLRGIEKKPMPYLLCQMNLLLHGIDRPHVDSANALSQPIADVRRDGVDVIMTNPPFGGEEERLILGNFKPEFRTTETVWLFLQAVMARLERSPSGRCGIVVPNSVLFDQGVGGRIKAKLMSEFNLHTVVRMPNGVFAPYTIIPSNVLFFDKGKQRDVWFYEIPLPEGRKNYTKTKPLTYEEFADCTEWWGDAVGSGRTESEHAWQVPLTDVKDSGYNLDRRNPNRANDLTHRPPAELVTEMIRAEKDLLGLLEQLQREIKNFRL